MKLHLPKGLRAALLACLISATGLAHADYTWIGGETITADAWKTQRNWFLDSGDTWKTGPQVSGSDMWENIVIDGASGEVDDLEGWCFKLNLGLLSAANLTINNISKIQASDNPPTNSIFNIGVNSTLTMNFKKTASGNDGRDVKISLGYGSKFTINLYGEKGGGVTYIDLGLITGSATLGQFYVTTPNGGKKYNTINFTGTITDKIDSTTDYSLHELTLGSIGTGVELANLRYAMQGSFIDAGSTATLAPTAEYCGQYTVKRAEDGTVTLYYVTGALAGYTWNGTNDAHVWNTTETNKNWLNGDTAASYVTSDTIFKSGTNVSSVVTIGENITASRILIEDSFSFEVAGGASH